MHTCSITLRQSFGIAIPYGECITRTSQENPVTPNYNARRVRRYLCRCNVHPVTHMHIVRFSRLASKSWAFWSCLAFLFRDLFHTTQPLSSISVCVSGLAYSHHLHLHRLPLPRRHRAMTLCSFVPFRVSTLCSQSWEVVAGCLPLKAQRPSRRRRLCQTVRTSLSRCADIFHRLLNNGELDMPNSGRTRASSSKYHGLCALVHSLEELLWYKRYHIKAARDYTGRLLRSLNHEFIKANVIYRHYRNIFI